MGTFICIPSSIPSFRPVGYPSLRQNEYVSDGQLQDKKKVGWRVGTMQHTVKIRHVQKEKEEKNQPKKPRRTVTPDVTYLHAGSGQKACPAVYYGGFTIVLD